MANPYGLNFRHLRLLAMIDSYGSVSIAARNAGISQPALTQALSKLEASFGASFFHRTPAGVTLTAIGTRVLKRVDRAMETLGKAIRATKGAQGARDSERLLSSAQVRGLLSLAEAGSFVGAAKTADVSVPALHRAVRDLEQLCGVSLVRRSGRGVSLTDAGTRLSRGFGLAMSELSTALDECGGGGQRLAIGAMALSRSSLLPATLAELLRQVPEATIDVIDGSYLELVDFLRSGRIDSLIGALRDHPARDLHQEPLFTNRLTIIGRADHPLAKGTASFEDLAAYPWIVARRASGLLEKWQEMFDQAGKPRPTAPIQCGSVELIRGMLMRSDFLTMLSTDQVATEIEAGALRRIDSIVPDTMRRIGIITRREWHPTPLQDLFISTLKTVAEADG
ncbi:LysR family transcriptional regulator [Sphingomonas montanisoli]|uniref:LysR family transcriptional regulator n=1 Tax=Sphingomonas montanisoli TaxID=2606412 RepID=A0A5D9CCZ5_9SPHN|nr:LysR family transcriptional regulator [Sphingomonas montanisoli]TZG29207.1 LysR family transcriptional regulator [Sphingomonas montanisoli]